VYQFVCYASETKIPTALEIQEALLERNISSKCYEELGTLLGLYAYQFFLLKTQLRKKSNKIFIFSFQGKLILLKLEMNFLVLKMFHYSSILCLEVAYLYRNGLINTYKPSLNVVTSL
jgi:hypothetical protein